MKKKFLRILFLILFITLPLFPVFAQITRIHTIFLYSVSGDEYLGKYWPPKTDFNQAYSMDRNAKRDNYGAFPMGLFEGCDLKMRITITNPVPEDTVIYLKLIKEAIFAGKIDADAALSIPDSLPIPPNVTYFEVPYQINHIPESQNGQPVMVSCVLGGNTRSEYINVYSRFSYHVDYSPRTVQYKGHLKVNVDGGSSHVVCSYDEGLSWHKPNQTCSESQMDQAQDTGVIYIKEPNSCLLEAIPFGKGSGGIGDPDPGNPLLRQVRMPYIADAIVSREEGIHYISSTSNFVFTIRPTGKNTGLVPVVTTDRTIIPDAEGVQVTDNGDGGYTVTVFHVQQAIKISVEFDNPTGMESTGNESTVWSANGQLCMQSHTGGIATVYNTTGTFVKTVSLTADETSYTSLPGGIYIISLNGKSFKVIIDR